MPTTPRDLFIGGEIGCMVPYIAGGIPEQPGTSTFDNTYARNSLQVAGSGPYFDCMFTDATFASDSAITGDTMHWRGDFSGNGSAGAGVQVLMEFRDNANFPWFSLRWPGATSQCAAYYNSGTGASPVWTLLGSAWAQTTTTTASYFVILLLGSPHQVQVVSGTTQVLPVTSFTQASFTSVNRTRNYGFQNINGFWSQMWATVGINLVGSHVYTRAATGAGTANTFTSGVFTDINEQTINDATNMVSNVAAQNYTFAMADLPALPSGYILGPVYVETRLKSDLSTPSNFATRIRSGATNYDYTPAYAGTAGYQAAKARWDKDPNTGATWTFAAWNAAEVGGLTS